MLLLLARHGNTFEAGEKAVWVGARTDLPLTAKGREQAAALAAGLQPIRTQIAQIVAGPLGRTRDHAEIVARCIGFAGLVAIDERLREIDYGTWEGKSSDEIESAGGGKELKSWNSHGEWPKSPGWTPSAEIITANVSAIAGDAVRQTPAGGAALLVTSNGILKFFLKLVTGAFEEMAAAGRLKVATGNCCGLTRTAEGWRMIFWDFNPRHMVFDKREWSEFDI